LYRYAKTINIVTQNVTEPKVIARFCVVLKEPEAILTVFIVLGGPKAVQK
jgi:hypothetical protein